MRHVGRRRYKGGQRLSLGLLALIVLGAADLRAQQDPESYAVSLPIGTEAPSAALQDLAGDAVELADYLDGRPTLIEFWASWCENCAQLQPQLDRLHARYGDQLGIVAVAVAVAQSLRRVRRHVEAHGAGYPYLWDVTGAAVRAYEVPTTSVVVIVGSEGRIAYTGVGPHQDLEAAVEALLGS